MQLFSVSRKRKSGYEYGVSHKIYENRLNQEFYVQRINQKLCTDFTYLSLTNGCKRYNCAIINLYDRSVVTR